MVCKFPDSILLSLFCNSVYDLVSLSIPQLLLCRSKLLSIAEHKTAKLLAIVHCALLCRGNEMLLPENMIPEWNHTNTYLKLAITFNAIKLKFTRACAMKKFPLCRKQQSPQRF